MAPASRWVQDISWITPTRHSTPLCSHTAGDPWTPQGHCRFCLLAGSPPTQADSKGSRCLRHQLPRFTRKNKD